MISVISVLPDTSCISTINLYRTGAHFIRRGDTRSRDDDLLQRLRFRGPPGPPRAPRRVPA